MHDRWNMAQNGPKLGWKWTKTKIFLFFCAASVFSSEASRSTASFFRSSFHTFLCNGEAFSTSITNVNVLSILYSPPLHAFFHIYSLDKKNYIGFSSRFCFKIAKQRKKKLSNQSKWEKGSKIPLGNEPINDLSWKLSKTGNMRLSGRKYRNLTQQPFKIVIFVCNMSIERDLSNKDKKSSTVMESKLLTLKKILST